MISLLASLLLSQVCTEEPLICSSVTTGQINTAHGLAVVNTQGASDPGSSLLIIDTNDRHDGYAITYRVNGIVVFNVDNNGVVTAGSQNSRASFVGYGDGATIGCTAAEGCQVTSLASMRNYSFHGAFTAGNDILRDGGLAIQVFGTGKSGSGTTVLAQDVMGNLFTYGGLIGNYLNPEDFGNCAGHAFNNDTGLFKTIGMQGYNNDTVTQQICTSRGWEHVCTVENHLCDQDAGI